VTKYKTQIFILLKKLLAHVKAGISMEEGRKYKILHWVGRHLSGLSLDDVPEDYLVSDKLVTIAIREEPDDNNLDDGNSCFIVNSLSGDSSEPLDFREMFRVWAIFTDYLYKNYIEKGENDVRLDLLDYVVQLVISMGLIAGVMEKNTSPVEEEEEISSTLHKLLREKFSRLSSSLSSSFSTLGEGEEKEKEEDEDSFLKWN